jgi:hypothetical protein
MGAELDALLGGSNFKTASDGSRLFFPLGTLGRGYVIASERDYQRLRRQVKIYYAVFLVLIIGVPFFLRFAAPFAGGLAHLLYRRWQQTYVVPVVAVLWFGFYAVWAWSLCRRLQRSNATLSGRRDSTQAYASAFLFLMTLVFVFGALLWASSVLPS